MKLAFLASVVVATLALPATAKPIDRGDRPILEVARQIKAGQYVWAPELAPDGPMLLVVNTATQRLIVFRNGVPMGASSVSTGKVGYETPTGVFTILEKAKVHRSRTYDNAPMPNMQRLTWKGISLHAGNLPGYPASHGCIRLPPEFAALLYGATRLGMTVIITHFHIGPELSAGPSIPPARSEAGPASLTNAPYVWHPPSGKLGMVSVVASTSDQRVIVLRDGKEIGSAPFRYSGTLATPIAYVLEKRDGGSRDSWIKLYYEGSGGSMSVSADEGKKFDFPAKFRTDLLGILSPGSVVIVTPQPLKAGSPGDKLTVIENDAGK